MLRSVVRVTLIRRWASQLSVREERTVNVDQLTQPPVRRRLLGSALRAYRAGAGYELSQAARIRDCDRSKVSRIETGQRGISSGELGALLTEYGVPGDEQAAPDRELLRSLVYVHGIPPAPTSWHAQLVVKVPPTPST